MQYREGLLKCKSGLQGRKDMEYSVGHTGRVILLRLDENEDVLGSLESLALKEKIETGIFFVIGSLKEGSLVSGAETEELPLVPIWLRGFLQTTAMLTGIILGFSLFLV